VRRAILALSAMLLAASPALALPAKFPPIDNCGSDPGLAKFRAALKLAVAKKDREAFLDTLAPDVLVNFGGESGRKAFASQWSFDAGEYGNVWTLLETLMRMGCARSEDARVIPSLFVQLQPFEDEDLFDKRVTLPGARLFKETGKESTAVPLTPWAVVTATSTAGDLWTGVRLADGRQGWISDDDLYEPLGYRMVIEKRDGRWMITSFVAGD
jgi:hypothetical protein